MLEKALILMVIGLSLVFFFLLILIFSLKLSFKIINFINQKKSIKNINNIAYSREELKKIAIKMAIEKYLLENQ